MAIVAAGCSVTQKETPQLVEGALGAARMLLDAHFSSPAIGRIAVTVVDVYGNESTVVKDLK